MFSIKSSTQAKNQFFGLGQIISTEIEIASDDHISVLPIKEIAANLFYELPELKTALTVFEKDLKKQTIQNYRGRPFTTIRLQDKQEEQSAIEELFFLAGKKVSVDTENEGKQLEEKFLYSLLTKFESFDKGTLFFNLFSQKVMPTLYYPGNLEQITKSFSDESIGLNQLRIGFEKFRPRFLSVYTGVTPIIYGYFYLELTPQKLKISSQQQYCAKNQTLPFEREGYIQLINKLLDKLGIILTK